MFLGTITDLKDHWSNHVGRGCLAGELELRKESCKQTRGISGKKAINLKQMDRYCITKSKMGQL
jgi:hypothetical protein